MAIMNSSSSPAAPLAIMVSFLAFSSRISLATTIWPLRSNWKATEPEVPRLPPAWRSGTDISGGTVAVVGQAVDVDGDTGGTVASYTMFS